MNKEIAEKKKMAIPDSLVIIVGVMILAAVLTYVIPAGEYVRTKNDAGQTIVDPASFHDIESSPVNPLGI